VLPFKFVPGLGAILPKMPSKVKFQSDFNLPVIENYHSLTDNQVTHKPGRAVAGSYQASNTNGANFQYLQTQLSQKVANL
jgi:hypothetical protein